MKNLITFVALTLFAFLFWAGICIESDQLAYQLVSSAIGGTTVIVFWRIYVNFMLVIFAMLTLLSITFFVDSDRLTWELNGIAIICTVGSFVGASLRGTKP